MVTVAKRLALELGALRRAAASLAALLALAALLVQMQMLASAALVSAQENSQFRAFFFEF